MCYCIVQNFRDVNLVDLSKDLFLGFNFLKFFVDFIFLSLEKHIALGNFLLYGIIINRNVYM